MRPKALSYALFSSYISMHRSCHEDDAEIDTDEISCWGHIADGTGALSTGTGIAEGAETGSSSMAASWMFAGSWC